MSVGLIFYQYYYLVGFSYEYKIRTLQRKVACIRSTSLYLVSLFYVL